MCFNPDRRYSGLFFAGRSFSDIYAATFSPASCYLRPMSVAGLCVKQPKTPISAPDKFLWPKLPPVLAIPSRLP